MAEKNQFLLLIPSLVLTLGQAHRPFLLLLLHQLKSECSPQLCFVILGWVQSCLYQKQALAKGVFLSLLTVFAEWLGLLAGEAW